MLGSQHCAAMTPMVPAVAELEAVAPTIVVAGSVTHVEAGYLLFPPSIACPGCHAVGAPVVGAALGDALGDGVGDGVGLGVGDALGLDEAQGGGEGGRGGGVGGGSSSRTPQSMQSVPAARCELSVS